MRLQSKSISKVNFLDILKRRKITFTEYLNESGIVSYNLLASRCKSMGVNPPTENQFLDAKSLLQTPDVSSPTEGVVVLTPPEVLIESTGKSDKTDTEEFQPIYSPPQYPKKKKNIDKPSSFSKKKNSEPETQQIITENESVQSLNED